MKNLISTIIIFVLLGSIASANEIQRFWIAGKVMNKIYTNYDVYQYMERAILDDAQRSELFEKAGKDYSTYKNLVHRTTKKSFESALKALMFNKVLEHHATSGKNIREWKAFRISSNDYYKQIEALESEVLKPLLDKRLGIVKSRDQFGEYLIKSNFPHKEGESNTDVYFRWYYDQKFRLKHQLRASEAKKYEAIASMGHLTEIYIRPFEANDFYKSGKKTIETNLNGKMMTQTEVSQFLAKNPELKLLIKDINYLSINTAPLSRILEDSESKFEAAHQKAIDGIRPSLSEVKIKKILGYEAFATKLALKYNDAEQLHAKSKTAMALFMNTGKYKDAMKSRLYTLAAAQLELKADRTNLQANLSTVLRSSFTNVLSTLSSKEAFTRDDVKKLLFEDAVSFHLKEEFQNQLGSDYQGYTKRVLALGAWVLEFDAKKIAFNAETEVSVSLKSFTDFDTYKKIQEYIKMKEFKKLNKKFRDRTLRQDVEGMFSVNVDGDSELSGFGGMAYDWLMAR